MGKKALRNGQGEGGEEKEKKWADKWCKRKSLKQRPCEIELAKKVWKQGFAKSVQGENE